MKLPPFDVPTWSLGAPPQTELTFQGVPIVWDERLAEPADADGVPKRAYWFRGDVAAALVKAGYEPVPAAFKYHDS